MQRILLDTQSNRFLQGSELEQCYDQRGGLCQADTHDVVVTTNPFDAEYLAYWQNLGFVLPRLVAAGPYDPLDTLSGLITRKKWVQEEIRRLVNGSKARLEFFCIEQSESALPHILDIPAYCNFDVSINLSRKLPFKKLCQRLALPTPAYYHDPDTDRLLEKAKALLDAQTPLLIKANDGIGGIACGSAYHLDNPEALETLAPLIKQSKGVFFIEERINAVLGEVVLHWEITETGKLMIFGFSDLITENYSYVGGAYPSRIPPSIKDRIISQLKNKLGRYLTGVGAKGHYCCDIIIDQNGVPYWVDFNPRKGATLYIRDMTRRLAQIHFKGATCCFWNESIQVDAPAGRSLAFGDIQQKVGSLLRVGEKPFITINNPGVIPFGCVNITGVSRRSRREAREVFEEVKGRLVL